ncbi:DoxX family protein [Gelidibacter sp. F63206]|uniref:DoxX family protein n=1 Tax=Gelidibacter sp. F63206 TaxID=2926425 RepID=UPI001FF43D6D|nr:MauE/DoxX family redox-associated membrane protein [Gelidibacter sp. F63206]MCK0115098.1 tellurium resistance protein TerC [Gelidibacter sp. F63206]
MRVPESFTKKIPWMVSLLFILLFVYAAVSKLLDFENFQVQLAQSPLLSAYAGFLAPSIIIIELLVSLLLVIKSIRLIGLYCSLFLMIGFTAYIYLILNYSDFIPCSCGGVIEKMSWTQHLLFNISFTIFALIAILIVELKKHTEPKRIVLQSSIPTFMVVGIIVGLFLSSEHIIKKENSFIRRFDKHPIRNEKVLDLRVNSYYFAGIANGKIYLGNVTAPSILTTVDTSLSIKKAIELEVDNPKHAFRSIQIMVKAPYFYIYDGNVPVIYRGKLGDSIANIISFEDIYFSQLQVIDSTDFVFRAQSSNTKTQVLGALRLNRNPKVSLSNTLLEKQVDGMFDTDGQLLQDNSSGKFVYVYTYRNQVLVMDSELNLSQKLHTIDTISQAQIQVQLLADGVHKMNRPPFEVNKKSTVHNGVLFNESNLMGRFESPNIWREASIIDMYCIDRQEYLGSFYVQNRGKYKMSQMLASNNFLFVLSGNELIRYHFAQSVTQHFENRRSRKPDLKE